MALPRSVLLSLWTGATLRGAVGPDDLVDAVRADDPQHLVAGWPGAAATVTLLELPGLIRSRSASAVLVAVPAPGDPAGLAGPPGFNAEALGAGEAVLVAGAPGTPALGLVPRLDARTVVWDVYDAVAPPPLDPGEASRTLRQTLVTATAELVRLDVASWQPEIPDLLLNLRHREPPELPPGSSAAILEGLERAELCLEIVTLALEDHGGAVSAYEIEQRRSCLTELDRAARRALVALGSDSLGST